MHTDKKAHMKNQRNTWYLAETQTQVFRIWVEWSYNWASRTLRAEKASLSLDLKVYM